MESSISEGQFTFKILMPPPVNLSEQGLYNWQKENWGTRMDAMCPPIYKGKVEEYIEELLNTFYWGVSFDTISSAPTEWLKSIAPMFPELKFNLVYLERTVPFCGELRLKNGKIITNDYAEHYSDSFFELAERALDYSREYFESCAPAYLCQGA